MRNFTSIKDVENPKTLVEEALRLKTSPYSYKYLGQERTLGLLFFNPSLRTRMSTQKAAGNLGMDTIVMNFNEEGWKLEFEDKVVMDGNNAEHIREAAAVISEYCDILGVRSFPELKDRERDYADKVLNAFIRHASIPVISLESAIYHPLQSLADMITIREHAPESPRIVLTWAPHPRALPQAVANSFTEWTLASGYDLTITHPEGYALDPKITKGATFTRDQNEALRNADIVYVKNWSSWENYGKVLSTDPDWMLTQAKLNATNGAKVMHCLPVRRNVVLQEDILDSEASLVIPQAANRVYAAQAVLKQILDNLE